MESGSEQNTILGGRYVLIKKLASGGMGQVYRAYDNQLDKTVAVKVMHKSLADNKKAIEMLRHEAKLCLDLTHPNIVRLYNLELAESDIFLVMEYIDGPDLYEHMQIKRRMTAQEVVPLLRQVLEGLSAAHSEGVVHLDIKPENLMLSSHGTVKIADFGIARVYSESLGLGMAGSYKGARQSAAAGTRLYMAPEQFKKNYPIGPQTDIYSLGCVVYELLVGTPPFYPSENIVERKVMEDPPPPDKAPPEFNRIVMKMLDRNPATRYQNAREILQDLTLFEAGVKSETEPEPAPARSHRATRVPETVRPPGNLRGGYEPTLHGEGEKSNNFYYLAVILTMLLIGALMAGVFIISTSRMEQQQVQDEIIGPPNIPGVTRPLNKSEDDGL